MRCVGYTTMRYGKLEYQKYAVPHKPCKRFNIILHEVYSKAVKRMYTAFKFIDGALESIFLSWRKSGFGHASKETCMLHAYPRLTHLMAGRHFCKLASGSTQSKPGFSPPPSCPAAGVWGTGHHLRASAPRGTMLSQDALHVGTTGGSNLRSQFYSWTARSHPRVPSTRVVAKHSIYPRNPAQLCLRGPLKVYGATLTQHKGMCDEEEEAIEKDSSSNWSWPRHPPSWILSEHTARGPPPGSQDRLPQWAPCRAGVSPFLQLQLCKTGLDLLCTAHRIPFTPSFLLPPFDPYCSHWRRGNDIRHLQSEEDSQNCRKRRTLISKAEFCKGAKPNDYRFSIISGRLALKLQKMTLTITTKNKRWWQRHLRSQCGEWGAGC